MKKRTIVWLQVLIAINLLSTTISFSNIYPRLFLLIEGITFIILLCYILSDLKYPQATTFIIGSYITLKIVASLLTVFYSGENFLTIIKIVEGAFYFIGGILLCKTLYKNLGLSIIISVSLVVLAIVCATFLLNTSDRLFFSFIISIINVIPSLSLALTFFNRKQKSFPDILHE